MTAVGFPVSAFAALRELTSSEDTSWADFARAIFDLAGLSCTVTDIPSSAYPTPAVRPLNSRLDCSLTQGVFGIARPDWQHSLEHILKDLSI